MSAGLGDQSKGDRLHTLRCILSFFRRTERRFVRIPSRNPKSSAKTRAEIARDTREFVSYVYKFMYMYRVQPRFAGDPKINLNGK